MERLTNAGNTMVPAILSLESKGYLVRWERGERSPDDETWFAEGPLGKFCGNDPVELLGLVAMREMRGPDWKASDQQIDEFMHRYNS